MQVVSTSRVGRRYLEHGEASRAGSLRLDTERCSVINEGLSEIIGPFPVPSPRDKRERNDDPGQKRRGHRYSVHPSNHTISIDYPDRRSVNYLDHSQEETEAVAKLAPLEEL